MPSYRVSLGAALVGCTFAAAIAAAAEKEQAHQHGRPERLGTVSFPTSCAPAVQARFTRAVALLHSFWYDEAEKAFGEVASADPSCAMAQWGVAMSLYHPIWAAPTPAEVKRGQEAVAKARAAGAPTERERDYIAAIDAFFRDAQTVDHRSRAVAYEKAMERLFERYPDDREAAILYSLALLGTASSSDKTYANQKKAGAILNRVLPTQPDHPGVAHYLIHSFDYPELAELALPAARSYSEIAESSPHALHMPSHIFVRLGLWDDSIRANEDSAAAARAHVEKTQPGATSFDELHAVDYLTYAFLQEGRDAEARAMVERVRKVERLDNPNFAAAYALAAVPARYALERGRWAEAAALEVAPASFPWAKFPYAEAITYFARAVGAARSGDPARAQKALERLEALRQAAVDAKIGYWPDQIEIQRRAAAGWLARSEGRNDDAQRLLMEAAELEVGTDKHPVTPGAVLPARELRGDLLMELGRPADALSEYEASLKVAPNRLYALSGAVGAAGAAGQVAKARVLYATLEKVTARSDGGRPDLTKLGATLKASETQAKPRIRFVVELDAETDFKPTAGDGVQTVEAFMTADKAYAIYEAESADDLSKYLERAGMSAKKVIEVRDINSPTRGGGQAAPKQARAGLKTYVIERKIPGVGNFPEERKQAISRKSNAAVGQIGDSIEWVHSYQTDEGTYCVYRATDEQTIRRHSAIAGAPVNKVSEVQTVVSPQ